MSETQAPTFDEGSKPLYKCPGCNRGFYWTKSSYEANIVCKPVRYADFEGRSAEGLFCRGGESLKDGWDRLSKASLTKTRAAEIRANLAQREYANDCFETYKVAREEHAKKVIEEGEEAE